VLANVDADNFVKALGDLTVLDFPSTASVPSLPFDARESNTTYEIHCDLPGIQKKDISLILKENELTISASRNTLAKEEGVVYRRAERHTGEVSRTIILPEDCEKDKIVAESKDGVLVITIPKAQKVDEAAGTVQIEVR
jgi:HSP20 family protein